MINIVNANHIIEKWKLKEYTNQEAWKLLSGQMNTSDTTSRKYINAVENFINSDIDRVENERVAVELEEFKNSSGRLVYVQKSTMMLNIQNMEDKTPNDLMRLHGYNPLKWHLKSSQNKAYQGTSKKQGTYTMFSSTIRVEPLQDKLSENQIKQIFDNFVPPKMKKIKKVDITNKDIMIEIPQTDFHLGLFAWHEESGADYDIKIAVNSAKKSFSDIYSRMETCGKILYPCGSDFFNVDNEKNTTTKGTAQTTDSRWQKMFRKGCEYNVWAINKLLNKTNKVDVLYINSNHDSKMSYFLILWLDAYYRNDSRVNVDISSYPRQYKQWGKCAIGYLHDLPKKRIDKIMQAEAPELWGNTKFREIHKGHLHYEELTENMGIKIRMISPITAQSDWITRQGFVGTVRQIQAFVWHKELGLRAIYNSIIEDVKDDRQNEKGV